MENPFQNVFQNPFRKSFFSSTSATIGSYAANGFNPDMVLAFDKFGGFFYAVGNTNFATMTEFTRSTTATFTDSSAALATAAINEARVAHYLAAAGGGFSLAGMLDEDGATNLIFHSRDFQDALWGVGGGGSPTKSLVDGKTRITWTSGVGNLTQTSIASGGSVNGRGFTQSFRAKVISLGGSAVTDFQVRISDGTQSEVNDASITLIDDGAYHTYTSSHTFSVSVESDLFAYFRHTGSGSPVIEFDAAQTEEALVPSSYITTTGSTVARASDALIIPAAVMAKAMADKAGATELSTDVGFDAPGDWAIGTGWDVSGSAATFVAGSSGNLTQASSIPTIIGTHILLDYEVISSDEGAVFTARLGENASSQVIPNTVGPHLALVEVTGTDGNMRIRGNTPLNISLSRFSWREVTMPAAISIAVDGFMTYADINDIDTLRLINYEVDSNERIRHIVSTSGAATGQVFFQHRVGGVQVASAAVATDKSPGVNVPISYAARHTGSETRGASSGVLASLVNPTSLTDVVTADFEIATIGNFVISTVRIWFVDIEDDGLVEATS